MRIPSAASRSPPMPNVSSEGSSDLSSRTTSEACRSPDASPATMASFMVGGWQLAVGRDCRPAANCQPPTANSFIRRVIHQPRQGDAADEQPDEHLQEEPDALLARALPKQREVDPRGHGVDEHQHDVVAEETHSFLPSAMSNTSSISSRFISPAVMAKAVPCS